MNRNRERLVAALHHAGLVVADVREAFERWTHILGLHGEIRPDGRAILRCAHEAYSLVLQRTDGKPFLDYVCYELADGVGLPDARRLLEARGIEVSTADVPTTNVPTTNVPTTGMPAAGVPTADASGRDEALCVKDPDGNAILLIARVQTRDRRPAEVRHSSRIPGFHPRKLGHVNFLTAQVERQVQWYADALGFRVTDWIGTEGVWLHVNSDHHVLAFLDKGLAHVHHLAFELVDWGEMRVALDHLAQNRRPIVWGPGRHGMARNLFSYFRMVEEELFIELFCDLEQLPANHQVRHYPDVPHSSNTWGALPPRTYFRFDREAVEAELEQREAYGQSTV